MKIKPEIPSLISVALGLLFFVGCETTDPNAASYIDPNELADSKEQAVEIARQLPDAEEVANETSPQTASPAPSVTEVKPQEAAPSEPASKAAQPPVEPRVEEIPTAVAEKSSSAFAGRVVLINPKKNFVIVDFGAGNIPPLRSELGVYRANQFVGSIRITPPLKGTLTAADILNGALRRGDEVR